MKWPALMWAQTTLAHPRALLLLAGVGLILAWSLMQADAPRKLIAPLIRALTLAMLVLALAGPESVVKYEGAARPALVDLSASITTAMREWSAGLLRDQLKLRARDPAILFARVIQQESIGTALSALSAPGGCAQCQPQGTDLEAALRALAIDPEAGGGPAVLVTDGWENAGDAERAIGALVAAHSRLYVFTPPGATGVPNVAMTELTLPRALPSVAPFSLGVTTLNMGDTPVAGAISVYENNRLLDQKRVTLSVGEQRFDFPVRSEGTGLVSYRAVFKPANSAADIYPEDDSLQGWVGIGARRRVLILTRSQRDASYLETAIKRLGLDPVVIDLSNKVFGGSLNGYDAVLLNDVPRSKLSPAAQTALAGYVEHGGSLAMIGGDQSFGLGGYQDSELAKVMPVVMKPPEHKQQQRALVLVIDKSGSMGREKKLVYAKAAARTVTKTLNDDDLLGVIGFDSQPFVIVPLQPLKQSRPYLNDMIDRLRAQGTTVLLPALKEAERDLSSVAATIKHVVILTDGETGGTATQYYGLVTSMHRDGGVTISTIAIGREPNLRLLSTISQYGGGGSYHTDSAENLPEIFLQDVKEHGGELTMVEKEFSPLGAAPDPVLKELAGRKLPALKGYVSTTLKPKATMDLFVERSGRKEPLIASWRYGAGKALAITTDANGRWSAGWIAQNVFTPVWDKLLAWMTPESGTAENFDVALGYRSGKLNIKLTDYGEATDRSAHLINAAVARPDGSTVQLVLSEQAPGEMAGSVDAPRAGTYYIELKPAGIKPRTFPPLAYTVSPAALAELPQPEPNYSLLERLASATGGRLNPGPGEISIARPTLERRESLSSWFLLAAMLLLIGEALVRRLTT